MPQRGSNADNVKYCSKWHKTHPEDYFFRVGDAEWEQSGAGRRVDICMLVNQYESYEQLVVTDPNAIVGQRQVILDAFKVKAGLQHTQRDIEVRWYYGESGTGKSAAAEIDVRLMYLS